MCFCSGGSRGLGHAGHRHRISLFLYPGGVAPCSEGKGCEPSWVLSLSYVGYPEKVNNAQAARLSRVSQLAIPTALGGRALSGKGIRVGIWDANVNPHPDFGTRVHAMETELGNEHGTHVAGSVLGAGLLDPRARGMAPEAEAWTWNFDFGSNRKSVQQEVWETHQAVGITLTQNSYGAPLMGQCGDYERFAYSASDHDTDLLMRLIPSLLHVFAAGNEQEFCSEQSVARYGVKGYGTSTRRAKNRLYVGAVTPDGAIAEVSSLGPQGDGRMFPTVCAKGVGVWSTKPGASYTKKQGTSMACPIATGSLALISERYKQLKRGEDIPGDLLRAVVANTATDAGRPHPDFQYGFGILNAEKAVEVLEAESYKQGEISMGDMPSQRIVVPEGVRQVKVMLVWNDPPSKKMGFYGESVLINRLKLWVKDGSKVYHPWVCSHMKGEVEKPAERKVDELNNIQQVTIEASELVGKELEIEIDGGDVAEGPQPYVVSWCYEMEGALRVISPMGPSSFAPRDKVLLQVDGLATSVGKPSKCRVEISYDGAKTFRLLGFGSSKGGRNWAKLPIEIHKDAPVTTQAFVRITDAAGNVAMNRIPFSVVAVPKNLWVETPACSSSAWKLHWDKVEGAKLGYEIFALDEQKGEALRIGHAEPDAVEFSIPDDLAIDRSRAWFTVAVSTGANGAHGQRAMAARGQAPATIVVKPGEPFESYFQENPSPWFSIGLGDAVAERCVDSHLSGMLVNAHLYGIATEHAQYVGTPFKESDFWAVENASFTGRMTFCKVDLIAIPSGEYAYLHLLRALSLGKEHEDFARFRVLSGGVPLADVDGNVVFGPNTGKPLREDLLRDYYWKLEGGKEHESRIEFVGKKDGDILILGKLAIFSDREEGGLSIGRVNGPYDAPKLGLETFAVDILNEGTKVREKVVVQMRVNGELRQEQLIERLEAFETKTVTLDVDLSSKLPMGEAFDMELSVWVEGAMDIQPLVRNFSMVNYGEVLPMATSRILSSYAGPINDDPKSIVTVWGPTIFTDNGGALDSYSLAQDATMKVKPRDPNMRLMVTFQEFDVQKGALRVYPHDVDDELKLDATMPYEEFTGRFREAKRVVSQAEDGALVFAFTSSPDITTARSGWIAGLSLVPRQNPLTLLPFEAKSRSLLATDKIPLSLTISNNWSKPIEGAVVRVVGDVMGSKRLLFTEKLQQPLEMGTSTVTLQEGIAGVGVSDFMRIEVVVDHESDYEVADNRLVGRAVKDAYCVPGKLREGEVNYAVKYATLGGTLISLPQSLSDNLYLVKKAFPVYKEGASQELEMVIEPEAESPLKLYAFVDWNNDGAFTGSNERFEGIIAKGPTKGRVPILPHGEVGKFRMRLAVACDGETVTACAPEGFVGSMWDVSIDLLEGKAPSEGDLGVESFSVGKSQIISTPTQAVRVEVENLAEVAFQGRFTLKAFVGDESVAKLTKTVDCASTPIAPGDKRAVPLGDLTFTA